MKRQTTYEGQRMQTLPSGWYRTDMLPLIFRLMKVTMEVKKEYRMGTIGGKQFATEFRGLIAEAKKRLAAAKLNVAGGLTRIVEQTKAYEDFASDLHKDADAMEAELRDPSSNGGEADTNQAGAGAKKAAGI